MSNRTEIDETICEVLIKAGLYIRPLIECEILPLLQPRFVHDAAEIWETAKTWRYSNLVYIGLKGTLHTKDTEDDEDDDLSVDFRHLVPVGRYFTGLRLIPIPIEDIPSLNEAITERKKKYNYEPAVKSIFTIYLHETHPYVACTIYTRNEFAVHWKARIGKTIEFAFA
jgi:hypothetical protein